MCARHRPQKGRVPVTAKKDEELRMPADQFDEIMGKVLGAGSHGVSGAPAGHTRDEIKESIRAVLRDSFHRKSRPDERVFMTAYQVLSLISEDVRQQLVREAGPSGKDAGWYHSAAKAVAKMLVEMNQAGEVEIAMLDSRCLKLDLEGQGRIEPGTYGCGLYRLSNE